MHIICLIFCLCFLANFSTADAVGQTCNNNIIASTPDSQLIDNSNGTVTDNKTGLMWKRCVEGLSGSTCESGTANTFTWQTALQQPGVVNNGSGFAGYHDWRLPNIKELRSLVEEKCFNPAINLTRFPNTTFSYVWSGSPCADGSDGAWVVGFNSGDSYNNIRNYDNQVRFVRGGQ